MLQIFLKSRKYYAYLVRYTCGIKSFGSRSFTQTFVDIYITENEFIPISFLTIAPLDSKGLRRSFGWNKVFFYKIEI